MAELIEPLPSRECNRYRGPALEIRKSRAATMGLVVTMVDVGGVNKGWRS